MKNYRGLLIKKHLLSGQYAEPMKEPVKVKCIVKQKEINYAKLDYYTKVWEISEAQDLHTLNNYNDRRITHALDHIIPISYGYKNHIPAEVIGNIKNLRFISYRDNLTKAARITNDVLDKMEELGITKQLLLDVI